MSSSDSADLCYVETANLDGETNLKLKYCYRGTKIVASAVDARTFAASCWVECERPNERCCVLLPFPHLSLVVWITRTEG